MYSIKITNMTTDEILERFELTYAEATAIFSTCVFVAGGSADIDIVVFNDDGDVEMVY